MLWFREPEAVTIWLVHAAKKTPYIPKRQPFKVEGRQYGTDLKLEEVTPKGTYIP